MVRNLSGVVFGAVVWMLGFFVLAEVLALLWPDYAIHGRQWMRQGVFTFTPVMACFNLAFWVLAEIAAGWTVAKIAKRREALWILAAMVGVYLASEHLVLHWSRFPWWYNVGVVIPAVAAVLVGGKLTGSRGAGRSQAPSLQF